MFSDSLVGRIKTRKAKIRLARLGKGGCGGTLSLPSLRAFFSILFIPVFYWTTFHHYLGAWNRLNGEFKERRFWATNVNLKSWTFCNIRRLFGFHFWSSPSLEGQRPLVLRIWQPRDILNGKMPHLRSACVTQNEGQIFKQSLTLAAV